MGAVSRPRYVAGMAYGVGHPSPAARHIAIPSIAGIGMDSLEGEVPCLLL